MSFSIAIDGPSASGKTEVSKRLADKLGFAVVDTGAIYRAFGLYCLKENVDIYNENIVLESIKGKKVELIEEKVFLDNQDITNDIRTDEVSKATSIIAQYESVREIVKEIQRSIASTSNVIMQGRDITSVVLPNADIKIYLTATVDVRAKRRFDELTKKRENVSFEQVKENIISRDYTDMTREVSPLVKTNDSVEIDSTNMSIDEVTDKIINLVKERGLK